MMLKMEEIRGAVARGWCAPVNSYKVMDGNLAEAISEEVEKLVHREMGVKASVPNPLSYQPRGDRVIVKRLERPASAADAMAIPDSQKQVLNEGTVVAVGSKVPDLKPGDHVCFYEFSGSPVEIDGEEYLSMGEGEIHGVRK